MIRLLAALMSLAFAAAPAGAQVWSAQTLARACPAQPGETAPPDFIAPGCVETPYWRVDPQNRTIWIEAIITLDAAPDPLSGPYGLYLSGKMAVEASVNGEPIGANGRPGFSAATETPGRMDSVLFLPAQILRAGANRVVLKASGHHSLIDLSAPVHTIAAAPYGDPRRTLLQGYQASLAMFGVFALGLVFFTVLAILSPRRARPALLAAIALAAGLQLIVETGRGLFAYTYPVHDLRLMAVAGGAAILAILVTAWSLLQFSTRIALVERGLAAALAVLICAALFATPGFDQKTSFTLLAGGLAAAAPPLRRAWRDRAVRPALWGLGFLTVAVNAVAAPYTLADRTLFWGLAVLLLAAVAGEARRFAAERAARLGEARRADTLAAALARAGQTSRPVQVPLVSAGRTDYADAADIARLNAADDYVEVIFKDGRSLLHTGALTKLEERLPASFLRVHRSCVVNTDEIQALERDAGGSGRLILKTAGEAPVSRRILPKVRQALDGAPTLDEAGTDRASSTSRA